MYGQKFGIGSTVSGGAMTGAGMPTNSWRGFQGPFDPNKRTPGATSPAGTPVATRQPQVGPADSWRGHMQRPLPTPGSSWGPGGPDPGLGSTPAGPPGKPTGNPNATGLGPLPNAATPPAQPPPGTESGPGILENWFNQRANGIDAASQYATKRGMDTLGDRYSAAGNYNSGAARQGESDMLANIESQRAGQLDALAGGASGEHAQRLGAMFGVGNSIAGGRSGINSAYDLSAAGAQSDALKAALGYFLNKSGVDSKGNQAFLSNLIAMIGAL